MPHSDNITSGRARYRDREEYQLARALLADVCVSTQHSHETQVPEVHRLRRTAVALPSLFLPSRKPLTTEEELDSQRIMLRDLAHALREAKEVGALDPESVHRINQRQQFLLARVEQPLA